jgi:HPt (histidine-containing phosphotransfer) domain-containing protein
MALPSRHNLEISTTTRNRYLKNLVSQMDLLRSAMERSDLQAVREICHRVRGSAGLFGLKDLGDACRTMEEAAMANQPEQMVEAFQVIEVIVARNAGGPLDAQV